MTTLADKSYPANLKSELPLPFLVALVAAAALFVCFNAFHFSRVSIIVLVGLPVLALLLFSFDMMVLAFVASLFSTQDVFIFKVAVPLVVPLAMAFAVTHTNVRLSDFRTGLTGALAAYFALMFPSIINSPDPGRTLIYMMNYALFVASVLVLSVSFRSQNEIMRPIKGFVCIAVGNAVVVIALGVTTGLRAFGFPGIVYVDFAPIVIMLLLTYFVFTPGWKRIAAAVLVMLLLASLLMTQTRSTLIALGTALALFAAYLVKNNNLTGLSRKKLALSITAVVLAGVIAIGLAWIAAPGTFERLTHLNQRADYEIRETTDFSLNSLITRMLIWMTAVQAFLAHPLVGIGAFSFPFSSGLYSTLPPDIFRLYVKGASPHITYLAALTETGVIGFAGFMVVLVKSMKIAVQSVAMSGHQRERLVSAALLATQIYICVSMFGTDAWLWGQCGMLWSVVLGLSLANRRVLLSRYVNAPGGRPPVSSM